MANYNNYSLSRGKGKLYLKSAEQKDGYEKVTYGTDNKVTYHKYFDSIKGTLKYFETKEVEHQGKKLSFLEVTLIDGDDNNKLSVPLKNSKGNLTDEVKALVSALNAADFGEEVTLTAKKSTWEKNGKSGENLNIYINYVNRKNEEGKGLSTGYIDFNSIPRAEKEEDELLGVTYNWKPVNKFYLQRIKEIQERASNTTTQTTTTNSESPQPQSQTYEPVTESQTNQDFDSLPF